MLHPVKALFPPSTHFAPICCTLTSCRVGTCYWPHSSSPRNHPLWVGCCIPAPGAHLCPLRSSLDAAILYSSCNRHLPSPTWTCTWYWPAAPDPGYSRRTDTWHRRHDARPWDCIAAACTHPLRKGSPSALGGHRWTFGSSKSPGGTTAYCDCIRLVVSGNPEQYTGHTLIWSDWRMAHRCSRLSCRAAWRLARILR